MLKIITIGKKHESWVAEGIERYQKRLVKPFNVEWVFLPASSHNGLSARRSESEAILNRLDDSDHVVLLDEKGIDQTSPDFSRFLEQSLVQSKSVVIVIGGAYGVDENLHKRANFVLSLSSMVFPHQLVRLILIEQIYRSQEIYRGGDYHHI